MSRSSCIDLRFEAYVKFLCFSVPSRQKEQLQRRLCLGTTLKGIVWWCYLMIDSPVKSWIERVKALGNFYPGLFLDGQKPKVSD